MAKQLQLRRGTTLQNNAFIGAVGEPTLDTETGMIHIHDGQTQGGKEFIDPVVEFQLPTSSNNQTWYRKYASGWVEMGGRAVIPGRTNTGGSGIAITFPVAMKNTFYTVQITIYNGGAYWASWQLATNSITTTGFTAYAYLNATATAADLPIMWSVKGVAA